MKKIIITGPECVGKSWLCKRITYLKNYITFIPKGKRWMDEVIEIVRKTSYMYIVMEDVFLAKDINYDEFLARMEVCPTTAESTLIVVSRELPKCAKLLDGALLIKLDK